MSFDAQKTGYSHMLNPITYQVFLLILKLLLPPSEDAAKFGKHGFIHEST
jgi:hypothetical protein